MSVIQISCNRYR